MNSEREMFQANGVNQPSQLDLQGQIVVLLIQVLHLYSHINMKLFLSVKRMISTLTNKKN